MFRFETIICNVMSERGRCSSCHHSQCEKDLFSFRGSLSPPSYSNMKHNERARVAPLYLTFTHPFRTQKIHERPPAAACGRHSPRCRSPLPFATLPACGGERSRTTVAMSRRWRSSWRPQAAASQRPSHRRQLGARFKLPRSRA